MNKRNWLALWLCVGCPLMSCDKELESSCPDMSHVHAVDLGLSVEWACCNIGATAPEEVGDYFAWGETAPKKLYYWNTYEYGSGNDVKMTKYCTSALYGKVDYLTVLAAGDDVARIQWGDGWRMPTSSEIYELAKRCTWLRGMCNGVEGYLVEGPNDNTIFFPCSGTLYGKEKENKDKACCWSSEVAEMNSTAYCLYFEYVRNTTYGEDIDIKRKEILANLNRFLGMPVRAVRDK